MNLFDKLFDNKKKKGLDAAMENAFQNFVENNPIMKKAKKTVEEAGEGITKTLEEELYGEAKADHSDKGSVIDNFDERSREWDSMFDQIVDRELSQYTICPECGEASPAGQVQCPYCGAYMTGYTADVKICPHCGAKNKALDLFCTSCGESLTSD